MNYGYILSIKSFVSLSLLTLMYLRTCLPDFSSIVLVQKKKKRKRRKRNEVKIVL